MDLFNFATLFFTMLQFTTKALPLPAHPLDNPVHQRLLELTQGGGLVDGLVMATTIVEGGPVYGRPRMILGGEHVHPGLNFLNKFAQLGRCPIYTQGYKCLDWVPMECQVVRHLYLGSRLCICKVDVC